MSDTMKILRRVLGYKEPKVPEKYAATRDPEVVSESIAISDNRRKINEIIDFLQKREENDGNS